MIFSRVLILFSFLLPALTSAQKFEELALTPPMGWNSWNKFHCKGLNEKVVRDMADAMVRSGMKDAGYEYIVLDDCWQIDRDENGYIIVDAEKFPSGMKALGDYIHSKGLKFGIYSCAGRKTCQERLGSHKYEKQDAEKYAEWGVDYLKYDWCHHIGLNSVKQYTKMRDALYDAGRPIVFSICEWGTTKPWLWAKDVGHLWRTTHDIIACHDCKKWLGIFLGWTHILDKQVGLEQYAGPGHWNDPDMLEVGNGSMIENQSRAHFTMWCMLAAPLMAGNDLSNMTQSTKDILTNKEVIAIDQDPLGKQGYKARDDGDFEVWIKELQNNEWAFCFLNRGNDAISVDLNWKEFNIPPGYKLRDLWKKQVVGNTAANFVAEVSADDVLIVRLINH